MHLIGWQNTWESDSRRPRHPFPALMAGVSPNCVPVHTALKKSTRQRACHQPVQETMPTSKLPTVSALSRSAQAPCQCTATGESQWSLTSETMGSCLCAPTGDVDDLEEELQLRHLHCDEQLDQSICCGTRRARQPVQELHLWNGHVDWQHHVSSVELSNLSLHNGHITLSKNPWSKTPNTGMETRPAQQGHRPPEKYCKLRSRHGLPSRKTMGIDPQHDREINELRRTATAANHSFLHCLATGTRPATTGMYILSENSNCDHHKGSCTTCTTGSSITSFKNCKWGN